MIGSLSDLSPTPLLYSVTLDPSPEFDTVVSSGPSGARCHSFSLKKKKKEKFMMMITMMMMVMMMMKAQLVAVAVGFCASCCAGRAAASPTLSPLSPYLGSSSSYPRRAFQSSFARKMRNATLEGGLAARLA
jgi:hypothetical protein